MPNYGGTAVDTYGNFVTVVEHGATASTARPTGAIRVFWRGSVQPTNAVQYDRWVNTTSAPYVESIFNGATWDVFGSGTYQSLSTVAKNRNRGPRQLIPSFGSWRHITVAQKPVAATYKSSLAGYGADVVWDPATRRLVLLAGGYNGTTTQLGVAYSDDGLTWTDYGSNPVFGPNGTGGQPDSGAVAFGQLHYENNQWYMYYTGFPTAGYEQGTPSICYATAPAVTGPWTRRGAVITTASFPGGGIGVLYRPNIIKQGNTYYLFTNAGAAAGAEDIWYFTAPAITGPWTVGSKIVTATVFSGSAVVNDPEVVRYGDWFLMFAATNSSIVMAYADVTEFPATWHPVVTPILTNGGLVNGAPIRPVYYETPAGQPALLVAYNGATTLDLFMPTSALAVGPYAPETAIYSNNFWYRPQHAVSFTTAVAGAGYLLAQPFKVDRFATLKGLAVNVTAGAAASAVRMGVYADNGFGQPGALLLDAGTVASTGVGVAAIGGLTLALPPGTYWSCAVAQGGSPTVTSTSATCSHFPLASASSGDAFAPFIGVYQSGITGALPATWGATVTTGTSPMTTVSHELGI